MVQLSLPQNSRPTPGKAWPKPAGVAKTTEFRVYRWNPDDDANPRIIPFRGEEYAIRPGSKGPAPVWIERGSRVIRISGHECSSIKSIRCN